MRKRADFDRSDLPRWMIEPHALDWFTPAEFDLFRRDYDDNTWWKMLSLRAASMLIEAVDEVLGERGSFHLIYDELPHVPAGGDAKPDGPPWEAVRKARASSAVYIRGGQSGAKERFNPDDRPPGAVDGRSPTILTTH